ncbi:RNA 2',3'-cyclic phosphodiesterase [Salibacterium aidingense]|uniref:RNA 2',3'-cyclic phosphodiesterase n=1 Tax=Salibacterium aidingense TaxID=384933 RepID=UPI003BC881A2
MDFHYFLALPVPAEAGETIAQWKQKAKSSLSFKKWVHKNDYHITLFFLGAASQEAVDGVSHAIRRQSREFPRFSLKAGKTGFFGRPEAPKILWAGVEGPQVLQQLQSRVSETCGSFGFSKETRPYHPHITIARKWQGNDSFPSRIETVPPLKSMKWTVEEVVLYRTHWHTEPKYEAVEKFPLADDIGK